MCAEGEEARPRAAQAAMLTWKPYVMFGRQATRFARLHIRQLAWPLWPPSGIIVRPTEQEWAGFDVHGEAILPYLAAGLLEVRIRSVLQDLLRTTPGCAMQ